MEVNTTSDQVIDIENLSNVINIDGTQAILMNGQYYIPLFSENDNQYIVNADDFFFNETDNVEPERCNTNEIVQLIDNNNLGSICEVQDDQNEIIYFTEDLNIGVQNDEHNYPISIDNIEPSLKRMNLETVDLVDAINNIENISEILGNDPMQEYQYVLKFENTNEISKSVEVNESVDFSKITGKNLLTGQIVTLDGYLEKIKDSTKELTDETLRKDALKNLLYKKITIGKTSTGQKLVGKIIHVGKKTKIVQANKRKLCDNLIKKEASETTLGHVSRTLSNLMEMESVAKELKRKMLSIKINEKCIENGETKLKSFQIRGHFEMRGGWDNQEYKEKWIFVLDNDESKEVLKFSATTKITITLTRNDGTVQSTKVTLQPSFEKCRICSKEFKTIVKMNTHMKSVHNVEEKSKFSCELCEKSFDSKEFFETHLQNHIEKNELFLCSKCDKCFLSELQLAKHTLVHDPDRKVTLTCVQCDKIFNTMFAWRRHMLMHTNGLKSFFCTQCSKQFYTIGDYSYHRKIHEQNCRFSCKVCNRKFTRYSNLQRHTKIHRTNNSISVYSCSECGCTYNYVSSLTRHIIQNHVSVSS